jgi:hypothetical protein
VPNTNANSSVVVTNLLQALGNKSFTSIGIYNPSSGTDMITMHQASGRDISIRMTTPAAANRVYTLPDAGADTDFTMNAGTQTISGSKTFSAATTNFQAINIQSTTTTSLLRLATSSGNASTLARVDGVGTKLNDPGSGGFFLIDTGGNASVNKTFAATALTASNTTNQLVLGTTTVNAPAPAAPRTYSLPDVGANAEFAFASSLSTIPMTGRTFVQYNSLPTGVGSNTLYTCPAGKKVAVINNCVYNPTAGAISYFLEVSRGGVYRQVIATASVAAGARSTPANGLSLDPGDILSINITASGLSVVGSAILVPSTNPITTIYMSPTLTPATFYTCPVGKYAYSVSNTGAMTYTAPTMLSTNPTGGSVTIQFTLTKGATTYSLGSAAIGAGNNTAISLGAILEPGDIIQASATALGTFLNMVLQEVS